jgi:hypothetical protein
MKKLRTPLHKATRAASLLLITLLPAAYAIPITPTFPVVNTNADGSVVTPSGLFPGDLLSFDLIGGNNGSGLRGETDFLWTAQATGRVQFLWSYTSCYPPNAQSLACDSPGYDWTGYMVNPTKTLLTDTDTEGVAALASFEVSAGSVFGWYVGTLDNMGEPGTVTVSDISFTPASSGIPEPGTLSLCVTGIVAVAVARRRIVNYPDSERE